MELRMRVVNSLFSDRASKITEAGHSKAEAVDCVQRYTAVLEQLVIVGHLMPSCTVFLAKVGLKACIRKTRWSVESFTMCAIPKHVTEHIRDISKPWFTVLVVRRGR